MAPDQRSTQPLSKTGTVNSFLSGYLILEGTPDFSTQGYILHNLPIGPPELEERGGREGGRNSNTYTVLSSTQRPLDIGVQWGKHITPITLLPLLPLIACKKLWC